MRTVAIIQARTGSTRLPGKVLLPIGGKAMIWHVVDRGRRSGVDEVVLATSQEKADDPVADFCAFENIPCFRGSLGNLLERYYGAAKQYRAEVIVRLTGDCPLLDPSVIRRTIGLFGTGSFDYVSNCDPPTFPDGLDTEVFSFAGLERAYKEAVLPSEKEHVSPFFTNRRNEFRLGNLRHDQDLSPHRWTVDQPEDLEFVRQVYAALGAKPFGMDEVLALVAENPYLRALNTGIVRNAGHASALKADEAFLRSR